jgi:hypothetical protein
MDIDKSSLQLMLRLLNADDMRKTADEVGEYDRIRHRLHTICSSSSLSVGKNRSSKPIALEDTTVSIIYHVIRVELRTRIKRLY